MALLKRRRDQNCERDGDQFISFLFFYIKEFIQVQIVLVLFSIYHVYLIVYYIAYPNSMYRNTEC